MKMEYMNSLGEYKSLSDIYEICFKIQNEQKATVFVDISGHTGDLSIDLHEGGWYSNSEPTKVISLRLYNQDNYSKLSDYEKRVKSVYKELLEFYNLSQSFEEIQKRKIKEQEKRDFEKYKELKSKFEKDEQSI